jgi:hypothetical protein
MDSSPSPGTAGTNLANPKTHSVLTLEATVGEAAGAAVAPVGEVAPVGDAVVAAEPVGDAVVPVVWAHRVRGSAMRRARQSKTERAKRLISIRSP